MTIHLDTSPTTRINRKIVKSKPVERITGNKNLIKRNIVAITRAVASLTRRARGQFNRVVCVRIFSSLERAEDK